MSPRRPRAIRLEAAAPEREALAPDDRLDQASTTPKAEAVTAQERRSGWSWGGLFAAALGGVVSIAAGLWLDRFIREAWDAYPGLGIVVAVLAALAGIALLAMATREIAAILRLRHIAALRAQAERVVAAGDDKGAQALTRDLVALYRQRPETAAARARIEDIDGDIVDAADRIAHAERALMAPLDVEAARRIAEAAQRVSLVTAISPRALVDVLFVAAQSVMLLRAVSAIYGGRPGFLGFLKLGGAALGHLALTGGIAAADSVVQQLVGQGLAARLSAKLGEGVLNGLLTARFGLAAMRVCRPLPFVALEPPGLSEVAGRLLSREGEASGRQSLPGGTA